MDDPERTLMVHVYGDISGDIESSAIVAACYLGREEQWQAATNAWSFALRDAGVKLFHATDFYSCQGEFAGWTLNADQHIAFAKRFTAIADDAGLIGFAFGMDTNAFSSILAPVLAQENRNHTLSHPRTYSAMKAIARVAAFLEIAKHPLEQRVQIVFESEPGGGRFENCFRESQQRKEGWTRWFQSFTTDDKSLIPLQIADLLAHEGWRRTKAFLTNPSRKPRKSFDRMLLREGIELQVLDRDRAIENARYAGRVLQRYPNGLTPPAARLYADGQHDDTLAFQWHLDNDVPLQTTPFGYLVCPEQLRVPVGLWLASGIRPRPYVTRLTVEKTETQNEISGGSLDEDPTT